MGSASASWATLHARPGTSPLGASGHRPTARPPPPRHAREDVTTAYKLLLRRPPDPQGLEYYQRCVDRGFTLDELAASLMNSDEFRRRIVPLLPGELKTGIRRHSLAEEVVTVDLGGYVVCVRASDQDFGRAIIATRDYEPHVRRFLAHSIRAGQVVVDVGANVGSGSSRRSGTTSSSVTRGR